MYWLAEGREVQLGTAQPRGGAYKRERMNLVLLKASTKAGHGWQPLQRGWEETEGKMGWKRVKTRMRSVRGSTVCRRGGLGRPKK